MIRLLHAAGMQRAFTALVFAANLLVLAMAASPDLHQWLHGDADESDHQCAVATAVQGQLDRPPVDVAAVASPCSTWIESSPTIYVFTIARLFLLVSVLEHAPPVCG